MVNEERPQDFELIELLTREAAASTSVQQSSGVDESFRARFQSYIDQIPSYMHSVEKKGFFPHFFFGSFSTLLDTEIAEKLSIEKICFSFDGPQTLKVAVIKKGEIRNEADAIDKVRLFVISEQGAKIATQKFSRGELMDALGRSNPARFRAVFDNQDKLKVKLVTINKDKINQQGVSVVVADKELHEDNASQGKFKEIEKGLWSKPEDEIAKLTGSNKERVKESVSEVLRKISEIHSKYENSLSYAKGARESAHHGFIAGALNNFRYRHNLRVYLEQFAGRGYADIILLPRGSGRALDSIPIIIELKAGTGYGTTPGDALQQAIGYAKGFQPNVMRFLTISGYILCVGVNLDNASPISSIEVKSRETEVVPLFRDMLESTDRWSRGGIVEDGLKTQIQDNIERIYHTFPGTGEKGDNHYFSRVLLGQSLLSNEALGTEFEKHVFIYGENIPTEIHSESVRPQRPAAQAAKDKFSAGLDASHAVVTMVFIPESDEKLVYVINVVEADGRAGILSKGVPLDGPKLEIGNRKIAELNLNFNVKKRKSGFREYFNIEANEYASLEQYNSRRTDKFQGAFRKVPYPNELKETFDRALDSQLTSAQSSSIDEYNELFEKVGKAIFPFESLINGENDFQGVLDGAFSHYSDLRLQESPETRALVLTEFQTGRGKRADMLVHGIKFDGSNAKEYTPIGLELKGPRGNINADALKREANKQITKEYERGVTYKTLTDGNEVKFIGVVFDNKADSGDTLISLSRTKEEGFIPVKVVHSSRRVLPTVGKCSEEREKRSIGMACVDSRDEEDITKEEERRIKELFDTDEIREITKNIQFYDQLYKVSELVSKGEQVNSHVEEALIAKLKDIDLYLIDQEIRDIVGEIKEEISGEDTNKLEKIKDILTRPRVAEKISEAAKGVGLTYRKFLDGGAQDIISKINDSPEAMSHLNRIGKISGWAMEGMMYKNLIGDILSGNLEGVAINLGFIGGSHLLGKVANTAAIKGGQFISEGKLFFGKSLKAASPFLARATSAFIAYDLANQVEAFKSGDKNAMAGIVGDSIALTVDSAAIGIEVAEVAGILSGVSSITGPIGAGITAVVFIGTDVYLAVRTVEQEDKIIHLTGWEKFKEGWRAFLHMKPEEYIEELIEEKLANNHLVENAVNFLKQHTGIQRYIFPTGKLVDRRRIEVDLNNRVLLNEKRSNIKWDRARPDNPGDGELFCLPEGDWESVPGGGAYLCENAIGLSYSTNRTGNYTLIDLGGGNDEVIGFQNSPNIFLVGNGFNNLTGGSKDDFFILQGNDYSSGIINGGHGSDTLDLTKFALGYSIKMGETPFGYFSTSSDGKDTYSFFKLMNIQKILGREKEQDEVQCGRDLKYVDGRGGKDNNHPDRITIDHAAKLKVAVRPNTEIINRSCGGNFDYIAFHGKGRANVNINHQTDKLQHNFLFNYTISDLKSINVRNLPTVKNNSYPIKDVEFSFQQSPSSVFDIGIKNVANNAFYVLTEDKTEVKIGNEGSLYLLQDANKPIDEIVKNYPAIANRLNATVFAKFQDELVVIGHGKHEVMSNNPLRKSHLVGNGGENVYVITPTQKEVSVYDVSKESSIGTLDLRNTAKGMRDIQFSSLKVSQDKDDLLIKLEMERSPLKFPIRLKNGVQWYQKLHVVLNINMQLERNDNDWILSPLPLIFDENTKTIVITAKDIEEGNKLIVHKQAGHYTFLRLRDDLVIITDSSTGENDICTISLSNFYREPKMETLSIEFNDITISVQEKMNEINSSKLLFCSSVPQVNEPFSIDARELLNNHDCLKFDSDNMAFFRSNNNLLLLSDQGMSVISNYYPNVHKQWNLPIELNDSIIKPEEFREKADDPSSLRYYLPVEEGLQIYHNQPTDKYQVGLVDLKNRSILDCGMKIVDKSLILSSGNNTIVKVENWVTSQATRKVMFAFNDAIVFNPRCVFVTCNQEDIIKEFNQEKRRVRVKSNRHRTARLVSEVSLGKVVEKDNLDSVNTLHHAVMTNNHAMAQLLINEGTDIEARDNDGRTPLQCAVSLDNSDMVQLLLNKGGDIETRDNDGRTPLQCAVSLDNSDMVQLLLDKGADIETKDYGGNTPLSRAVTLDNLNMVQLLLNREAYIYSKDDNDKTIFEIAHEYHKVKIVNYLITKEDKYGNTILHYAAEEGNFNLVELLLDNNAHIGVKNSDDWTPLHLAVKEGKLDVVELLMRKGANIDAKDNSNQTPLHVAVQIGNFDIISLIVNKIESINFEHSLYTEPGELVGAVRQRERLKFLISEEDRFGYTPLQYAAKEGKWDIVNFFLDKTAERGPDDVANKDQLSKSWTTVHYAVYNGDLNLIKNIFQFLSDKDAIVNTKDSSGWTPLHYVAFYGASDIVKLLIDEGANINVEDNGGKTPLKVADENGHSEIVSFLEVQNRNLQLREAARVGNLSSIEQLLGHGASIEAKDNCGYTSLHEAAGHGRLNVVKFLVNKGANISTKTNTGMSPLELANKSGYSEIVDFLRNKQVEYNRFLFDAVENNDLSKVRDFLGKGANIEAKTDGGLTPLHLAVKEGKFDIAKLLLNGGANIEAKTDDGLTPLHLAVKEGKFNIAELLLNGGANIQDKTNDGMTSLHYSTFQGDLNVVRLLLGRGANIGVKNNNNQTSLHIAARESNSSTVRLIINEVETINFEHSLYAEPEELIGAVSQRKNLKYLISEEDDVGCTPLRYAAKKGKWDIVNLFLDKTAERNLDFYAKIKDELSTSWTTLHYAVYNGDLNLIKDIFQFLPDKDNIINTRDSNGATPLHYSALKGNSELITFLLDRGANIEAKNNDGLTPLYYAIFSGDLEVPTFLLNRGANIEAKDNGDKTPLYCAVDLNKSDMTQLLLDRRANIEAKDNSSWTPLYAAVLNGNLELTTLLLDRRANIEAKDNNNWTPLYAAVLNGNLELTTLLLDRGANIEAKDNSSWTPLYAAVLNGNLELNTLLLDRGANIEAKDNNNWTPLYRAVFNGNLELTTLLLDRRANIEAKDNSSWTPLYAAVLNGNLELTTLLLDRRANIEAKDNNNWTPLYRAVFNGNLELTTLLLDRGANIWIEDRKKRTPLKVAHEHNRSEILKYLVEYKGSDGRTPLYFAAEAGNLDRARFLLDNGANIESKNGEYQATPLHGAVANYRLDVVRLLLSRSANVNAEDKCHQTPLHYAADTDRLDIVKSLVDAGANLGAADDYGKTPLGIAKDKGHSSIAEYLEEKLSEKGEKPVQRKRRHHHGDHPRHYDRLSHGLLAADLSNQPEVAVNGARQDVSKNSLQDGEVVYNKGGATSGASKPSSPIDAFAHIIGTIGGTIVDNIKGAFQLISSPFKPVIDMEHSQTSKAMTTQSIDTNGTLLLLDVFIRKITGQKYISTADQPVSLSEARGYALNITTEFKKVLKDTAKRSGVSVNESSFNYFKTYQAVEGKMISGELSKIPTILYSAIEEAYPKNEKFLSILKGNIEKMLDGQQIVNNRNGSNQMQNTIAVSDKMPLSSLNSIAIEPLNGKKGVTCAGRVA